MEIKYGLKNMVEDDYKFNYDFDYDSIDKTSVGFRFGHNIKAEKDKQEIILSVFTQIVSGETVLVNEGVRAVFSVEPFDSLVASLSDDGMQVKEPLLINTFINVAIGAVRGMLVKNLKGTPLDGCVLPLIPMNLISDNVIRKNE